MPPRVDTLYFKHEDEGDGTYDGQIGRAFLNKADGSTGEEGLDLGFMTLAAAAEVARDNGASLDVDGPSRAEWSEPYADENRLQEPERARFRETSEGTLFFVLQDEGDGTYNGQIGRAYLRTADGATRDELRELREHWSIFHASTGDESFGFHLGWMTLATAAEMSREHRAPLHVDGPSRATWLVRRLLGRSNP